MDRYTDVGSTQFRQTKGQIKSIFLCDSDEEALVEFIKQHEELFDKTHTKFKEEEGRTLGETSSFQELICQHRQEVVQDHRMQETGHNNSTGHHHLSLHMLCSLLR